MPFYFCVDLFQFICKLILRGRAPVVIQLQIIAPDDRPITLCEHLGELAIVVPVWMRQNNARQFTPITGKNVSCGCSICDSATVYYNPVARRNT